MLVSRGRGKGEAIYERVDFDSVKISVRDGVCAPGHCFCRSSVWWGQSCCLWKTASVWYIVRDRCLIMWYTSRFIVGTLSIYVLSSGHPEKSGCNYFFPELSCLGPVVPSREQNCIAEFQDDVSSLLKANNLKQEMCPITSVQTVVSLFRSLFES